MTGVRLSAVDIILFRSMAARQVEAKQLVRQRTEAVDRQFRVEVARRRQLYKERRQLQQLELFPAQDAGLLQVLLPVMVSLIQTLYFLCICR